MLSFSLYAKLFLIPGISIAILLQVLSFPLSIECLTNPSLLLSSGVPLALVKADLATTTTPVVCSSVPTYLSLANPQFSSSLLSPCEAALPINSFSASNLGSGTSPEVVSSGMRGWAKRHFYHSSLGSSPSPLPASSSGVHSSSSSSSSSSSMAAKTLPHSSQPWPSL
ncbi:unnamed protein product, partial [Protopolystoma xenopodis]